MIFPIPNIDFGQFVLLLSMPRSRAKSKIAGSKHYYTGKPCKYGHLSERYTGNGHCIACNAVYHAKYNAENREAKALYNVKYRVANREALVEYGAKYRVDNRESIAKRQAEHYADNREVKAEYNAKYQVENRETIAEYDAKYRVENPGAKNEATKWSNYLKLGRTMPWSDREAIKDIYKRCSEVSAETGIPHNVDHVYPLNGDTVSGLHVVANLQIITARENRRKFNKHPEG